MERIYKSEIKKQLKSCIKGRVYVHFINDILIVDIEDEQFNYFRVSIGDPMSISAKTIADVIIKEYRTHVLQKYFY